MNTETRKFKLHDLQSGSAITVRITPRAARNEISEILDDGTIKVRLVESKSGKDLDRALITFLAQVLDLPPNQLDVVAGNSGVDKLVTIMGMKATLVEKKILEHRDANHKDDI